MNEGVVAASNSREPRSDAARNHQTLVRAATAGLAVESLWAESARATLSCFAAVSALARTFTESGRLFPLMSFVVLGFGIAMTANGDIAYNQFWIVFGLIAWALSAATGILFLGPESKRLNKAAAEHGPKSPEVQARLRRILLVVRVDVALMFLIVFDMVAKPFS